MSEIEHLFGGNWTEEKLDRLRGYLPEYTKIMKNNPVARQHLRTVYIDAFAGTGYRADPEIKQFHDDTVFDEVIDDIFAEIRDIETPLVEIEGSAQIALDVEPSFDRYIFIEKSIKKAKALEFLRLQYYEMASQITIMQGDANDNIQKICSSTDWSTWRAVAFLDPYGMQVEWKTLEAMAQTKAVDLWLLVPIGMGVLRMLTKNTPPDLKWSARLTSFFGTEDWKAEFYKSHLDYSRSRGLVPIEGLESGISEESLIRDADFESITKYFLERLSSIFFDVSPEYLVLRNKGNIPMYILCFAAANETGSDPAIRIASYLLSDKPKTGKRSKRT